MAATTKPEIDMSPQAIAGRLEVLRQLYRLCMSLKAAGKASLPREQLIRSADS